MSELPAGVPRAIPVEPRLSAAGLVIRKIDGVWHVLQALRARGTRFMPGHLAFPGGALDPEDRPDERGAFRRCVAREVQEETGLDISEGRWRDAGRRITPPLFPVRFDNKFFVVEAPSDWQPPEQPPSPAEIEMIAFDNPKTVLAEWAAGRARLPPPSLSLLRALVDSAGERIGKLADRLEHANDLEERVPRIEFVPGIWMVPLSTATLPPASHTNVWMPGGDRFVVIDHGSHEESEHERLRKVIERRRADGGEVAAVVLTHAHQDHVGLAPRLARELDVPLRADRHVLDALNVGSDVRLEPIADGETIDLGGMTLIAMLTPGHAPGHLAFRIPERRALIAGDLISGISTILIDPLTGDMGAYLESLRKIDAAGCKILLPGHGPPVPARAIGKLIEHRLQREARVLAELTAVPTGLPAVARSAYSDAPELPAGLVELQALAHLLDLERRGRVTRDDPDGFTWCRPEASG